MYKFVFNGIVLISPLGICVCTLVVTVLSYQVYKFTFPGIVLMLQRGICTYIYFFPTGLQLLLSPSNNCHWVLIIDIIIFKLFEPPSYDFHFYNDLEHSTRKQRLFIFMQSFISQKQEMAPFQRNNRITAIFWLLDFETHLRDLYPTISNSQ